MTNLSKKDNFERDFKGVWIPKEIWLSGLPWSEKILLTEIDSLDKTEEGCYASNEYLGKFLQVSPDRISSLISLLKNKGLIYQVSFDGRNRVLKSSFYIKNGVIQPIKRKTT